MSWRDEVRAAIAPVLLMAAAAGVIARVQPGQLASVTKVKETSDVYPLPPPEQLPTLSLGYRAAAADLIWARLMVVQGERLRDRRKLEYGARYFESIFALEPTYRRPWLLLDTILTFGAKKATAQDAYDTRRLFEQGLRARPDDAQLHLVAGGFMAYLAPSMIPEAEYPAWRLAGAELLTRAVELGGGDSQTQWHALSGAGVLSRNGQRAAAVTFLERAYNLTDDAELRGEILKQLQAYQGEEAIERAQSLVRRFEEAWRDDMPYLSRTKMLLLGPKVSV
ncbi:MAG: hypothetical protein EOO75_19720, partial [Myxococcales bacterium]